MKEHRWRLTCNLNGTGTEFIISWGASWNGCVFPQRRGWNFGTVWSYHLSREGRECVSVDWSKLRIQVISHSWVSLFVACGVGGIFEWVVSFILGESWVIGIDLGSLNPMHRGGGTKCSWLKWDNDCLGVGDNRPVNPLHFKEGTSCLSLKWDHDWSGLEEVIS